MLVLSLLFIAFVVLLHVRAAPPNRDPARPPHCHFALALSVCLNAALHRRSGASSGRAEVVHMIKAVLAVDEGCMRMRCTLVVSARRLPRAGTRKLRLTVHDTCGLGSSHVLWAGSDYL